MVDPNEKKIGSHCLFSSGANGFRCRDSNPGRSGESRVS